MLEAGRGVDEHKFPPIFQQHLIVRLHRHLEHVIVKLVTHEPGRCQQNALHYVKVDVPQDGLHYVVVELRQTLQEGDTILFVLLFKIPNLS